jgi:hypothetical protein
MQLIDGYDRRKHPKVIDIKLMPLSKVLALTPGSHVSFIATDGKLRTAKVNGCVKRWKRNPERFELPLKYGMYECTRFTNDDLHRLVEVL